MAAENLAASQRSFYLSVFSKQTRESRDEEVELVVASNPSSGAGVIVRSSFLDDGIVRSTSHTLSF